MFILELLDEMDQVSILDFLRSEDVSLIQLFYCSNTAEKELSFHMYRWKYLEKDKSKRLSEQRCQLYFNVGTVVYYFLYRFHLCAWVGYTVLLMYCIVYIEHMWYVQCLYCLQYVYCIVLLFFSYVYTVYVSTVLFHICSCVLLLSFFSLVLLGNNEVLSHLFFYYTFNLDLSGDLLRFVLPEERSVQGNAL